MSGEKWIKQREQPLDREMPLERYLALRESQYLPTGHIEQPLLPYFEQQEQEEMFKLHQDRLWRRWFRYYCKCQDPEKRLKLIDQYNRIFTMHKRNNHGRERE